MTFLFLNVVSRSERSLCCLTQKFDTNWHLYSYPLLSQRRSVSVHSLIRLGSEAASNENQVFVLLPFNDGGCCHSCVKTSLKPFHLSENLLLSPPCIPMSPTLGCCELWVNRGWILVPCTWSPKDVLQKSIKATFDETINFVVNFCKTTPNAYHAFVQSNSHSH